MCIRDRPHTDWDFTGCKQILSVKPGKSLEANGVERKLKIDNQFVQPITTGDRSGLNRRLADPSA